MRAYKKAPRCIAPRVIHRGAIMLICNCVEFLQENKIYLGNCSRESSTPTLASLYSLDTGFNEGEKCYILSIVNV